MRQLVPALLAAAILIGLFNAPLIPVSIGAAVAVVVVWWRSSRGARRPPSDTGRN
jgi:hypothetical protein